MGLLVCFRRPLLVRADRARSARSGRSSSPRNCRRTRHCCRHRVALFSACGVTQFRAQRRLNRDIFECQSVSLQADRIRRSMISAGRPSAELALQHPSPFGAAGTTQTLVCHEKICAQDWREGGRMGKKILTALVMAVTASGSSAANLTVNCGGDGEEGVFRSISAALAHLSPIGPNTVTVYGACHENVVIQGIDRLTLIAKSGASISDASAGNANVIDISDSQRITVQGFTINGGADGVDCHNHSFCHFQGNTIQGSAGDGVSVRDSQADFNGDVIQDHGFGGLDVNFLANVSVTNVTIQRNANSGVDVLNNSFFSVFSPNKIQNNFGVGVDVEQGGSAVLFGGTISGNSGDGVALANGSKVRFAPSLVISGNSGHGVSVGNLSAGVFAAGIVVSDNQTSPDVLCYGKSPATVGALANLGGGTTNCTEP